MKKKFKNYKFTNYLVIIFLISIFTGCTHKISISPDVDNISGAYSKDQLNFNVAYILSAEKENIYVVTSGGGGDKVGYYPYRDTESSLRTVLNNLFNKVYKIDKFPSDIYLKDNNIKYIFDFEIETQSFSKSAFTWPPTNFTINLRTYVRDINNNVYWEDLITEVGNASFDEFVNDFGIAGKKAVINVSNNLYFKIKRSKSFQ